jgi:hypothetical protein
LRRIDDACGTHVQFRLSETPCFFPKALAGPDGGGWEGTDPATGGESGVYLAVGCFDPGEFRVANEPAHPMFVQVDFGLVRDAGGELQPKLVELQAFPSLYAYQVTMAQTYIDVYGLENRFEGFGLQGLLNFFLSGLTKDLP